jgi:muramidase (phage lysozyme)
MLAWSEIGTPLLRASDNGYDVLVGSTAAAPLLFHGYASHPNIYNTEMNSTAAGRYQILYRFWTAYRISLNLPDFSPASQDAYAIQQLRERRALPLIAAGRVPDAIARVSNIWASLPGAGYNQHEHKIEDLLRAYREAGGALASS